MYHQRVLLIVVLYISTRTNEAFELKLTASKPIIAPILKESLELKCELQATDPLELFNGGAGNITSITVSRGDNVIASISSCGPAKTFSDHQTISVKGEVSGDSGYLQLHWATSSTKQAGNYTCSLFLETGEQAAMLNKVITIKARQPSVEELLDVINKLNEKVEMSEKEIQNLSEEMASQSQDLRAELDLNLRKQAMRMETGYHHCERSYNYNLTESGKKRSSTSLNFTKEFDSPPIVFISIIYADTTSDEGQNRYYAHAEDVSTKGFNLVCETWASSAIYRLIVYWIALKN